MTKLLRHTPSESPIKPVNARGSCPEARAFEWLTDNFHVGFLCFFPACVHPCDIFVGHVPKLSPFCRHTVENGGAKESLVAHKLTRPPLPAVSFLSSNTRGAKWRASCETRLPESKRTSHNNAGYIWCIRGACTLFSMMVSAPGPLFRRPSTRKPSN